MDKYTDFNETVHYNIVEPFVRNMPQPSMYYILYLHANRDL